MQTFFHSWRRKVGVVTLVMAYGLMGMWIRSFAIWDIMTMNGMMIEFISEGGRISCGFNLDQSPGAISWLSGPSRVTVDRILSEPSEFDVWRRSFAGFSFGRQRSYTKYFIEVPYAFLTIPMSLLSTYLILWKPRKLITPTPPG